jgi:hypothetical protein
MHSKSKRKSPITLKCRFPSETQISRRFPSLKTHAPNSCRPGGIQIDESDEQSENVDFPIEESREPDSNVTVERDLHRAKHCLPSVSTEKGMQIDESDEQFENVDSPIDESREPDSNVTVERDLHPAKHCVPSVWREEGIQIFSGTSVAPFSVTQRARSTTLRRTPPTETQFRGKTDPVDREQSQNAFIPSDL